MPIHYGSPHPALAACSAGSRSSAAALRRLRRPNLAALSTLLPHGVIDAARALEQLGSLHVDWPTEPLWMPAVRTHDGQRVVFGRDEHPPLGAAIGASCAIPLLLRPVKIGKHHYIDGATHSPTNADLLVDAGVEVAIVIAPMSGRSEALRRRPDHALRAGFARRLRDEARQLVDAGVDVHLFEPDAAGLNALGINPIDRSRTVRVVPHAFLATGSQIQPSLTAVLRVTGQSTRYRGPRPCDRSRGLTTIRRRTAVAADACLTCVRRFSGETSGILCKPGASRGPATGSRGLERITT